MSFWDWVPDLIETGVSIWGASQAADAQKKSAQIAAQSQAAQTNLQREATQAEIEAINVARQQLLNQQGQASPGLMHTQEIIGRGEELTPDQQRALDDARRTTLNTLQGGSLRGSARATAETIADVEGRMRDVFRTENRNRSDTAATNLTGQYFNAGDNVANLNLATGTAASKGLINQSSLEAAGGQNRINTNQNLATIRGQALGDISAVIADQVKAQNTQNRNQSYGEQDKDSSYEKINWNSERQGAI